MHASGREVRNVLNSTARPCTVVTRSTQTPRESGTASTCHHVSLSCAKSNRGKSAASSRGDLPMSQLFSTRSRAKATTRNDGDIGCPANTRVAVSSARVSGEVMTSSTGRWLKRSLACRTCSRPRLLNRASKWSGSAPRSCQAALNVDSAWRRQKTVLCAGIEVVGSGVVGRVAAKCTRLVTIERVAPPYADAARRSHSLTHFTIAVSAFPAFATWRKTAA